MKNAPAPTKTQGAILNQSCKPDFSKTTRFLGTDNPRHLRFIAAVLVRPRRREDVDSIAGCSNGSELVAELRRRGLEVPCERIRFVDRDGYLCRPGVYSFTSSDRCKFYAWQATCRKANG